MATQNKSVTSAEHDFYVTKSGLPGTAAIGDHMAAYWGDKGADDEDEWLANMLQATGGTNNNQPYDRWMNTCISAVSLTSITIKPGRSIDECKFNFFTSLVSLPSTTLI
jgi:hypothetical protein